MAARDLFPTLTGIYGLAIAIPGAMTAFSLPFLCSRVSFHALVLANITVSLLAILICTLGNSLAGPFIGTVLGGVSSAVSRSTNDSVTL